MKRNKNSDTPGRPSRNTAPKNTNKSSNGKREFRRKDDEPRSENSRSNTSGRRFNGDTGERPAFKKRAASSEENSVKRTFADRRNNEGRDTPNRKFEGRERRDDFRKKRATGDSTEEQRNERNDERKRTSFNRLEESTASKGYARKPRQEDDTRPKRTARTFNNADKPTPRFRKRDNDEQEGNSGRRPSRYSSPRKEESRGDITRRKPSARTGFDRKESKPFGNSKPGGRQERDERRSSGGKFEDKDRTRGRKEKSDFNSDKRTRRPGNAGTEERPKKIPFQNESGDSRKKSRSLEGKSAPEYDFRKYESRKKNKKEESDNLIRLNRYIANAGVCSRRDADSLIEAGEIKVNGKVVTEMGYQVSPNDIVKYGNRVLNKEKLVYVLLNKPKDFITTTDDPDERKTVMDLVKNCCEQRIYPVGRLDRNTTGLLLLTNDGEVAEKLSHPSNDVKKIYQVELDKPITEKDFQKIIDGVELEDGKAFVDEMAVVSPDATVLGLEIHIGRNRIVRRIFEHLGYEVIKLDRVSYAGLTKKDLPRGQWRFLTEKEVIKLKYFV